MINFYIRFFIYTCMDSYDKFINTQPVQSGQIIGKLYIETDDSEFTEEWKLTLDMTQIWADYSSQVISLLDFNNEYATILTNNSEVITKACGEVSWQEIEPYAVNELRKATNADESETIYNHLYDLYDKYEINIVSEKTITVEDEARNEL